MVLSLSICTTGSLRLDTTFYCIIRYMQEWNTVWFMKISYNERDTSTPGNCCRSISKIWTLDLLKASLLAGQCNNALAKLIGVIVSFTITFWNKFLMGYRTWHLLRETKMLKQNFAVFSSLCIFFWLKCCYGSLQPITISTRNYTYTNNFSHFVQICFSNHTHYLLSRN